MTEINLELDGDNDDEKAQCLVRLMLAAVLASTQRTAANSASCRHYGMSKVRRFCKLGFKTPRRLITRRMAWR